MLFKKKKRAKWNYIKKQNSSGTLEDAKNFLISEYQFNIHDFKKVQKHIILSTKICHFTEKILKIYLPKREEYYLLKANENLFLITNEKEEEISISKKISLFLGIKDSIPNPNISLIIEEISESQVNKIPKIKINFKSINLCIKDYYYLTKKLENQIVNKNDIIKTHFGDFLISDLEKSGKIVETTQFNLYSQSNYYIFFVEISKETFDENKYVKELNIRLIVKKFGEIIETISQDKEYQKIRIIPYARMFYPNFKSLEDLQLYCIKNGFNFHGFQINTNGKIFKDFYDFKDLCLPLNKEKNINIFKKYVYRFLALLNWKIKPSRFRKLYNLKCFLHQQLEGELSYSVNCNFLEALNLFLSKKELIKIKKTFCLTGIKCVIFSCGIHIYNVEKYFYYLYKNIINDHFVTIFYYSFQNYSKLKKIMIRFFDYESLFCIKNMDNYVREKKSEYNPKKNRIFLVHNDKKSKNNLLRSCIKKFKDPKTNQILTEKLSSLKKKTDLINEDIQYDCKERIFNNFYQTYKGIMNFNDDFTNLKLKTNEEILEKFVDFKNILIEVFKNCEHENHYLPLFPKASYLELDNRINNRLLKYINLVDLTKNKLDDNLVKEIYQEIKKKDYEETKKMNYLNSYNQIHHHSSINFKNYEFKNLRNNSIVDNSYEKKHDKKNLLNSEKIIFNYTKQIQSPFKVKNPINKKTIKFRKTESENILPIYTNLTERNILGNIMSKDYLLIKKGGFSFFLTKNYDLHEIINLGTRYRMQIKNIKRNFSICKTEGRMLKSNLYRFIYQYELFHNYEKKFLHKKIEFSKMGNFKWNKIYNIYYMSKDPYPYLIEKYKDHLNISTFLIFYKDFDLDKNKFLKEFELFFESLNFTLEKISKKPYNKIDIHNFNKDNNFIIIEAKKIFGDDYYEDEIYLKYSIKKLLKHGIFKFQIYSLFSTQSFIQKFFKLILTEVNRFDLIFREICLNKNQKNEIDESIKFLFHKKLNDKEIIFVKDEIFKEKLFYLYKIENNCLTVFDKNILVFLYIMRDKIEIHYNQNFFQNYDTEDFQAVWNSIGKLRDFIKTL